MSETASPTGETAPADTRRATRRRRWRLLCVAAVVCLMLFAWYYVRGTRPDPQPTDPQSTADGVITQLVVNEAGQKEIRTAVLLPVSVEAAWDVLSDYDEWERLFKTVREKQVAEPVGENQHHVVTDVLTPLGTISLDFIVTHEELPDGGYRATWDAPTPELPVNRGTIRISPTGPQQTLLVYSIEKQYRQYPQFLVNNVLFDHQEDLVGTLGERIVEAANER